MSTSGILSDHDDPVAVLNRLLGAPNDPANPFSPIRCAESDSLDEFPTLACAVLNEFGLGRYYVPKRHGGAMEDIPQLLNLWRTIARRDLGAAIAHGKTFLGAITTWVGGTPDQKAHLSAEVTAGTVVSWGLTERHHGSDLLAGELTAERIEDGWRLHGEKWLINNATRGQMICVLARTDPRGGSRGFSLFMVDKRRLPSEAYHFLPKELTLGIRGADISGIGFDNAVIPTATLIGKVGEGAEISLKALQVTRVACVAMSLGAAEHALSLAVSFAHEHELYGRRLIDLPLARRSLGEAWAMMIVAEVVTTVAARCIHAAPEEMSVVSSVTKAFVPSLIDDMIGRLGELIGARAYLSDVLASGMFQKLERDHRLIAIFDGNTLVSQNLLINQFPALARAWHGRNSPDDLYDEKAMAATALTAPLPEFAPSRLTLLSPSGCSVVQRLPTVVARLRELAEGQAVAVTLMPLVETFLAEVESVIEAIAAHRPVPRNLPAAAFTLAERYELCFVGAACLEVWLHNRDAMDLASPEALPWHDGLWLEAAMVFILARLRGTTSVQDGGVYERLADLLTNWRETSFSLLHSGGIGSGR